MNRISLLGSTGSIGTQSLEVCENLGYEVAALTAYQNDRLLAEQARRWRPRMVAIADESRYTALKARLADLDITVAAGEEGVCQAAALEDCDTVINAVVGIAGLLPTVAAIEAGKYIALANKETLVAGGGLVMPLARERGVTLLPVDSEHSAMLQCMAGRAPEQIRGVILTASGGPFYGRSREELAEVTPREAMAHPTWSMGSKITVDSATMMNKGLEFIETMWLFDLKPHQIEVVIHRQSVVHSAVELQDGSVIAQLGVPDMRLPIQYALTYPAHLPLPGKRLSLTDYGSLNFDPPDRETFRCLDVCIRAAGEGGLSACVANGANERAVALFLEGRISFLAIGNLVEEAVDAVRPKGGITLAAIREADALAREYVSRRAEENPSR